MNLTQISGSAAFIGSVIVLAIFAIPSLLGAIKQSGITRTISIFITLGLLIIGFETLAIKTGLPYGKFSYGDALNYRLLGTTPWIVALSYTPIVIGAFWLARKISIGFLVPMFTALFTTFSYVVLAPAMNKLGLWRWENPGPFFGVPLRSYVGWFVCAFVAALLVKFFWGDSETKRLSAYSWFAIMLFWAGTNLGIGQLVPGLIGVGFSILLFVLFGFEKRRDKSEKK